MLESFNVPVIKKENDPVVKGISLEEVQGALVWARQERLRALEIYIKTNSDAERPPLLERHAIELKNLSIDLLGVNHIPETAVKYSSIIEESISKSDFIFLEGSRSFLEEAIAKNMKIQTTQGPKTSEPHLSIDAHGFLAFFEYVALISREQHKDIYIADPVETDEAAICRKLELPALVGSLALMTSAALDPILKKEISRRTVLKLASAGVLVAASQRLGVNNSILSDYRNIAVSHAISSIDNELQVKKKMTLVYGAVHTPRIIYWLSHPQELEIAFKSQSFIDTLSSPPELRHYQYVDTPEQTVKDSEGRIDISTAGYWDTVSIKRF